MSPWRSWLSARSRSSFYLKRLALIMTAGSFLLALIIIAISPATENYASPSPTQRLIHEQWQKLQHAPEPEPYELVAWLDEITSRIHEFSSLLEMKTFTAEDYERTGFLLDYPVRSLLGRHSADEKVTRLWEQFISASLSREPVALNALALRAEENPPLVTAWYIRSRILKEAAPEDALAALMQEEVFHPGSTVVRKAAFHEATRLRQIWALKEMADNTAWWDAMPVSLRQVAAVQLGDLNLLGRSLLNFRPFENATPGVLLIALTAATVWYIILVMHGVHGRWRWVLPLVPMAAGVCSIGLILPLTAWQEMAFEMKNVSTFPAGLWYQVGGVGVREELTKLLFASLFMPWLLVRRRPGAALMVGAFVGLGFALEENINYYLNFSGGIALVRFFTANFMHAAMTGITAHALYELLRSRFGTAERFLVSVLGVIIAHGAYNFTSIASDIQGLEIMSMAILAFTAWHFLDLVDHECERRPQLLSPAAIFILGSALIMAIIFLSIALTTPDRQILASAGAACIGVFPVAFIYWRRLGG